MGAEAQWEQLEINRECNQTWLPKAKRDRIDAMILEWEGYLTVYYYSETEPTDEGSYWHYVDGVPAAW